MEYQHNCLRGNLPSSFIQEETLQEETGLEVTKSLTLFVKFEKKKCWEEYNKGTL